jgi:adenine deaminase
LPGDLGVEYIGQKIRVIKALDGELLTEEILKIPKVQNQKIVADPERDILLLTVVNRYRPTKPSLAFIQGFGLQQGALASSVAHDSHNIIAVGTDADLICEAVNSVINAKGGISAASLKGVELLPLPIVGLMSDFDGDSVAKRYAELDRLAKQMGSTLRAPFMTLSFMALLVIPNLKLSDQGLFDSRTFQFTSLTV